MAQNINDVASRFFCREAEQERDRAAQAARDAGVDRAAAARELLAALRLFGGHVAVLLRHRRQRSLRRPTRGQLVVSPKTNTGVGLKVNRGSVNFVPAGPYLP